MFPHQELILWVKSALKSEIKELNFMGRDWAERLQSPELAWDYSSFKRKYPNSIAVITGRLYRDMLPQMDIDAVIDLFNSSGEDVQSEIIHNLSVIPGRRTEEFLLSKVKDDRFRFSAIQSLGNIFALNAGHIFQEAINDKKLPTVYVACSALAKIRYEKALPALIKRLDDALKKKSHEENLEYSLLKAIAFCGGGKELVERIDRVRNPENVLRQLFETRNSLSITCIEEALEKVPDLKFTLIDALAYRESEDKRPWIRSKFIYSNLKEVLNTKNLTGFRAYKIIGAIRVFDLPEAMDELREIAANSTDDEMRRYASEFLASSGDERHIRTIVKEEIERVHKYARTSVFDAERLGRWPKKYVRDELLERADSNGHFSYFDLYLLRWFVEEEDFPIFQKHTEHSNLSIADLAYEFIQDQGLFALPVTNRH